MKKTKWGIIAAGGIALRRTIPAMPGTFEMHTKENAAISKHFI